MVSLSLPAPYPGGKSPRYPLGSSLGGAQSRSAVLEKRKNLLSLPEFVVPPRFTHPASWLVPCEQGHVLSSCCCEY